MADAMYRLVYRSDSNIPHGPSSPLREIFEVSCRNNRRDKITGALALPDGKFVQAIEGGRTVVDDLMQRLRGDPRHSGIVLLGEWSITARLFPGWAMAHPDSAPLSEQSFRIITENGSGAQCTGILLALMQQRASISHYAPTI